MATPEETFDKSLGLGESWRVVRAEYEADKQTFVICVEETPKLWKEESARLGQRVICYDHVAPMQWRHLNVWKTPPGENTPASCWQTACLKPSPH